jgi:hypothetical protein
LLNFAIQTARDAGRLLAERFGRNLRISNKSELDLVTPADPGQQRFDSRTDDARAGVVTSLCAASEKIPTNI